jgi:hypothetical protein
MVSDIRTVAKDFNRDLLTEQLIASALPFVSAFLAGFDRLNQFVGTPSAAPKLISKDGVAGTSEFAQPGEIRFEFTTALTTAEGTALDNLLTAHVSTNKTAEQTRGNQDQSDLDALVANFPNWDSFTGAQRNSFLKLLSRVVIREARQPPF